MHFISILTIQREASELKQSIYGERRAHLVSYRVYFFFFFFFFIITSFAQQQPQVDNEMYAVDRREPDKALLVMESPSTTPRQLPTQLPTQHEQRWPRAAARGVNPAWEGSRGAEPWGYGSAPRPRSHLPNLCLQPWASLFLPGWTVAYHDSVLRYFPFSEHFRDVDALAILWSPWGRECRCPLSRRRGGKLRHARCRGWDARLPSALGSHRPSSRGGWGWGWLPPCTPGTTEHPNVGVGQCPSSALLKDN